MRLIADRLIATGKISAVIPQYDDRVVAAAHYQRLRRRIVSSRTT